MKRRRFLQLATGATVTKLLGTDMMNPALKPAPVAHKATLASFTFLVPSSDLPQPVRDNSDATIEAIKHINAARADFAKMMTVEELTPSTEGGEHAFDDMAYFKIQYPQIEGPSTGPGAVSKHDVIRAMHLILRSHFSSSVRFVNAAGLRDPDSQTDLIVLDFNASVSDLETLDRMVEDGCEDIITQADLDPNKLVPMVQLTYIPQ